MLGRPTYYQYCSFCFSMENIDFSKYKSKCYKHIDCPISFEKVKKYVSSSTRIANHSFLPFLHYTISFEKYIGHKEGSERTRPIKIKEREIFYAGHLDSYIYRFYADVLNAKYNKWATENEVDTYSVAYRTNKKSQSSINFAASAISFIESTEDSLILIGDFKSFFDTLDHKLLKERLQRVLGVRSLSHDWYNVYKSLTKFGYLEKFELDHSESSLICKGKHSSYFSSVKDFRRYQRVHKCLHNDKSFGIPQGNSMSGVLANVYSIDFDKDMGTLARRFDGIYKRYSDDFIVVLSIAKLKNTYGLSYLSQVTDRIVELADKNKIILQKEKTLARLYSNGEILTPVQHEKSQIDYLGFTFDGQNVKMREKSIYKFYRNARHLIRHSVAKREREGLKKIPNRHKIYSLYTDFGCSERYPSNFIDYAKRAQKLFDNISPSTTNLMLEQLKNRKKIVERELGYRIHSRLNK